MVFIFQQVAVLIREVEAARFERTARHEPETTEQPMDADGAISERLVTFKNVQELQEKNAELLVVIREVTSKQEAQESKLVEERTADLKKELDSVREQLEELTDARRRQEALVENIIVQRDMYKSMTESKETTSTPLATSTPGTKKTHSPGKIPKTICLDFLSKMSSAPNIIFVVPSLLYWNQINKLIKLS